MDNCNNPDTTRPIRVLTMLSWISTLSLGIPYSVNNNTGFPAVGLVPMSFSACTAIFAVTGRQKRSPGSVLALDIFCTVLLFAIFIPSIVVMAEANRYMNADQTVVGTLGAAPMMLNLCCHLWFILREGKRRWPRLLSSEEKLCPHCHGSLRKPGRKNGYTRVADDEARESCDKARSHPGGCYEDEVEEGSAMGA